MMKSVLVLAWCGLFVMAPLVIVGPARAGGVIFSDDFNRPDRPLGNGWSDSPDNTVGPLGIFDEAVVNTVNGGTSGIFRPIPFATPLRIQAVITETDGNQLIGSRFTSDFGIRSDGTFGSGYVLGVGRTKAGVKNSRVSLGDNGVSLGTMFSPFQFDSELAVGVTFHLDGSVVGTISEGANVFKFAFGPYAIQSNGDNFLYVQEWNAPDSVMTGTMDNLVISVPAPSGLLALCAGFGMTATRRRSRYERIAVMTGGQR